jgi:hypothetical protein
MAEREIVSWTFRFNNGREATVTSAVEAAEIRSRLAINEYEVINYVLKETPTMDWVGEDGVKCDPQPTPEQVAALHSTFRLSDQLKVGQSTNSYVISEVAKLEDEITRLRVYEKQWLDHQNVIKACTNDETLHIQLRMNRQGQYITRDGVVNMLHFISPYHISDFAATSCKRYVEEMYTAIKSNTQQET